MTPLNHSRPRKPYARTNKKAVLSQRRPHDARYISRSWADHGSVRHL